MASILRQTDRQTGRQADLTFTSQTGIKKETLSLLCGVEMKTTRMIIIANIFIIFFLISGSYAEYPTSTPQFIEPIQFGDMLDSLIGIDDSSSAESSQSTTTWTGDGSDNLASTGGNWAGGTVPQSGDNVIFDNSLKDCMWDIVLTLSSFSTNSGYGGIIAVDENLSIAGDVNISGGKLILTSGNLVVGAESPPPPPSIATGIVTDSSTGLPLSEVSVILTDSLSQTFTTLTDASGSFLISGITPGNLTATFIKTGYADQSSNGVVTSGQTLTLDVQLTPYALSFEIIRPTDAYNPEGWVNQANGYDNDENTYSYKDTPNSSPSISFGGASSNDLVNAWQEKTKYWYSASLYVAYERGSQGNDVVEIVITDQNGNVKHTILSTTSFVWPKQEFVQKLNMSDWGDGFSNIANLRVRVNGVRVQGSDHAESRVYDIYIEGGTSHVVNYFTRGAYSSLPVNDNDLSTNYTTAEVANVDFDDGNRVSQEGSVAQYLIHQFKRKVPSRDMTIKWNGQINDPGVEAYAQSFKPNASGTITSVRIFFKKVGVPDGSMRVRIKSSLGSEVLAESNAIAETSIPINGSWNTFTFSAPASVTGGNTYYIEIWRNKNDAFNYPQVILRDCSGFENIDKFYSWRSSGSWLTGLQGPILFEADINNTLDVSTSSCYLFITPERNITGLEWNDVYLEAYNKTTSLWDQLDTALYDGSNTDINLLGSISSDDYFDENDWISMRVYTTTNGNTVLATDLIDFNVTPLPAVLTGTVTDLSTALPLPDVTIRVTDALNSEYVTTSNPDGTYSVSGLPPGDFTATYDKSGYIGQTVNGTLTVGVTKTVNVQLAPIPPLTIAITSPQDGGVLTSSPVTVTGNVSNNAYVTVNDVEANVSNGTFSLLIPLSDGQNTITAVATDSYSQTATHSINITFITHPVISNITVSNIAADSATITWTTDQQANSVVDYGTTTAYGSSVSDPVLTVSHSITLSGLTPGTTYYFKVTSTNTYGIPSSSGDNTFITISPSPPVISNIVVSNITADSAVLTWSTDQLSDSLVDYGTTTAYGSSESDASMTTSHSVTLTGLIPETLYHFKITSTNAYGTPSSSGDNTFTTSPPPLSVTTIGDYGNVTVMEITGNYDAKNPDGSLNTIPRQEAVKEFLRLHPDQYDFMVIFSNFDFAMPEAGAKAFYTEVRNNTQGIGKLLFNNSDLYGSTKLQGTIDMGNISNIVSNPVDPGFEITISDLAHEQMHRWGASIRFRDAYGNDSTALQGKDGTHWSYLLDSDASVLYGNDWSDNGDGTFTSTGGGKYYSPLDLYLAGFYDSSQVPQMLLIDNPLIDPTKLPEVGTTITGTSRYITINDIVTSEGQRVPEASTSQKAFKTAFILLTRPGTFNSNVLSDIETIRSAWAGRFTQLTHGKGTIMDIAPSISIFVGSPADGAIISGTDVTVQGAVINTTGNETGVTVNGKHAMVYGTRFIANSVALEEGSNTITVTATDTAGNTATSAITLNAVTTEDYIRLTSNIESGTLPLEVTLKVDGSFSIETSNISVDNGAGIEWLYTSADEYKVKMNAEGIYTFTVTASDSLGNVYEDAIAIMGFNKTRIDALLKGKWSGMKTTLASGDINGAVVNFDSSTQGIYHDQFTALSPILTDIVNELSSSPVNMVSIEDEIAQYEILVVRGGTTFSLQLKFVKDSNGLWKIWGF